MGITSKHHPKHASDAHLDPEVRIYSHPITMRIRGQEGRVKRGERQVALGCQRFNFGPDVGREIGHGDQKLVAFGKRALPRNEDKFRQAAFDVRKLLAPAAVVDVLLDQGQGGAKLDPEAAKRYITASLKREFASDSGTELNSVLPKMSPLNPQYLTKKQSVFQSISAFVEKFKEVGGQL